MSEDPGDRPLAGNDPFSAILRLAHRVSALEVELATLQGLARQSRAAPLSDGLREILSKPIDTSGPGIPYQAPRARDFGHPIPTSTEPIMATEPRPANPVMSTRPRGWICIEQGERRCQIFRVWPDGPGNGFMVYRFGNPEFPADVWVCTCPANAGIRIGEHEGISMLRPSYCEHVREARDSLNCMLENTTFLPACDAQDHDTEEGRLACASCMPVPESIAPPVARNQVTVYWRDEQWWACWRVDGAPLADERRHIVPLTKAHMVMPAAVLRLETSDRVLHAAARDLVRQSGKSITEAGFYSVNVVRDLD